MVVSELKGVFSRQVKRYKGGHCSIVAHLASLFFFCQYPDIRHHAYTHEYHTIPHHPNLTSIPQLGRNRITRNPVINLSPKSVFESHNPASISKCPIRCPTLVPFPLLPINISTRRTTGMDTTLISNTYARSLIQVPIDQSRSTRICISRA